MGVIEAQKVLGASLDGTLQHISGLLFGVDGYYPGPCQTGALRSWRSRASKTIGEGRGRLRRLCGPRTSRLSTIILRAPQRMT